MDDLPNENNSTFTRGNKFFELSNHMGNVLVTVSDRKIGIDIGSEGIIDSYVSDVVTANDYCPFGMMMPGRKYTGEVAMGMGLMGRRMIMR